MKPTPEMIEAFYKAHDEALELQPRENHQAVFSGLSAALSVPAAAVVGEPVAYASSKEWRKNHLMSAAQYKNALPKNVVDFDIPLYATLPDEALERSEQATFDIAARLLKERDALASRISQQDAELERLRLEVEATQKYAGEKSNQVAALIRELNEARKAAFIEVAEMASLSSSPSVYAFAAMIRAKAEETRI